MPTKTLPSSPSLYHLKSQAKDLIKSQQLGDREALQLIREFHPRFHDSSDADIGAPSLTLADAQLVIAREYGFASWARLRAFINQPDRPKLDLPVHERIQDPIFRRAVELLDAGDVEGLRAQLEFHPNLVHERVVLEGGNYFRNPSLLEFAAENPIRHRRLPSNIVRVATIVLEAGAKEDRSAIDSTLGLVCSGCVARECGVQAPLIDLLCDYGADPSSAMGTALAHGEFGAASSLLRRGARLDLPAAAALGRQSDAAKLLPTANENERRLALAFAAQYGHVGIVRLLLAAGVDPSIYNPIGAHSHSTPLHQAAYAGHLEVVKALIGAGASVEAKDTLFHGTPLGWAEHGGRAEVAALLRESSEGMTPKG